MGKNVENIRKRGRPSSHLIGGSPFSYHLNMAISKKGITKDALEKSAGLGKGSIGKLLKSGNPTLETAWAIEDALTLPRGALCAPTAPFVNQTETQEEVSEAAAATAPTPVSALPPGNAIRRKGDQDAAHKVLHLKLVGDAAALEKGASHRGGFDDESLYWDHTEEIPESTHLVRIRGDSMAPLMMHGQSVMVGTQYRPEIGEVPRNRELVIAEVTVQDNDIGGVDGEWEGVHCKRIQDGGDFWHFTSINPSGASFSVAKDNCRLWHVIGVYFGEKSKIPDED